MKFGWICKACAVFVVGYSASVSAAFDSAANKNFDAWKKQWLESMAKDGVSKQTIDDLLSHISDERLAVDQVSINGDFYLQSALSPKALERAKQLTQAHAQTLQRLEKEYGVPVRVIAAMWAIEVTASERLPQYPALSVLVNRAFRDSNNYRARQELAAAVKLLDNGEFKAKQFSAKADGTIGNFGFSALTMDRYGVDFNRDGRVELENDGPDVLASYAKALKNMGWESGGIWGREVRLPANFDAAYVGDQRQLSLAKWQQLGVRRSDGSDLPGVKMMASIVKPKTAMGRAYLVYNNYYSIFRWKRSHEYALSIGLMAEMLEDASDVPVFPFASN